MWYQRLFGNTASFAVKVGLEPDPSPAPGMDERLRATWGMLEIHAQGHCLTRVQTNGMIRDGIAWYLLPFLEWLDTHAIPLLNEEPFPALPAVGEIKDSIGWLDASLDGPPFSATRAEEDAWFEERSRWFERHVLRSPFQGAVAPYLAVRRLGGHIEISWDNEHHPPGRSDAVFLEPRGAVLIPAHEVETVLRAVMKDLAGALAERTPVSFSGPLANGHGPGAGAWKYLLHPATRSLLERPALASLRKRLDAEVPVRGGLVSHTVLTALLRGAPVSTKAQLEQFASIEEPASRILPGIHRAALPPRSESSPWREGYELAHRIRREFKWGEEPAPALRDVIRSLGVDLKERPLLDSVACAVSGRTDSRTGVLISTTPGMGERMKYATALGHLVMDLPPEQDFAVVSSPWSHWPTSARAKAFGAMLLMPDHAVRDMARSHGAIDADLVSAIMSRFGTEVAATTWHLYHLRMISDEARVALAAELRAKTPPSREAGSGTHPRVKAK